MRLVSSQFMNEKEFPFYIRRYIHTSHNMPPIHGHDFVELVYVVDGEATHVFEGEHYDVFAGNVFIINPGEIHTYHIKPGKRLEIINCLFMPSLIDKIWLNYLGISESMDYYYIHPFLDKHERFHHCLHLKGTDAGHVLSLVDGIAAEFEEKRTGYPTLIRLQLVQVLIQLSRIYGEQQITTKHASLRSQERNTLIQRICGYLERHYDQKISLATLSELFNISSRHLNRVFKEETGKTVIEAVHQIRIERAKSLLLESNEKVLSIAIEVGYDDPAFFTRLFSRQVGCSPGKFRDSFINDKAL
ncbi:helix-turn-helix domain-containing protein [Ectobacillus funiculus]|uniref:helix-turn-helix domain-containing protein n=1 Tax=Ectobacillus funiculus TaxID=137993 RepID=UPI00362371E3